MHHNEKFRKKVKDIFKCDIKNSYLPDQTYINRLIASLDKVEANSYNKSCEGFISEYKYLKGKGTLQSFKVFVNGCLNQLLWINTILESGEHTSDEDELEAKFDYITPSMSGDPWTLDKVTKKGVYFRGDELFQDSRVIITFDNIIEIITALSKVTELYAQPIATEKSKPVTSPVTSSSIAKESSLFKSIKLQNECLNVLKEISNPILDPRGNFLGTSGMVAAIVVWYNKCKVLGFISNDINDSYAAITKEIRKIIPNLTFVPNNFSQHTVANKYKAEIEQKLELLSLK